MCLCHRVGMIFGVVVCSCASGRCFLCGALKFRTVKTTAIISTAVQDTGVSHSGGFLRRSLSSSGQKVSQCNEAITVCSISNKYFEPLIKTLYLRNELSHHLYLRT